jgi:lipopolysaccharide transport system ATP-binding protein
MDAIVIENVVKSFRKSTIRREYTTFKSELLRWIRPGAEKPKTRFIEALRGIDLRIPAGQTVGILGRNGSGKSTLLKLITGIYTPTSGSIQVNGRISALLDLGAGFHPDFSGRENILINGVILGMTRAQIRARMNDIIAFSELGDFIDEPVRTYSSGMYMRLAFAVATHVDPDILIIDEILAVGDEHFSKKSLAKMNEFKASGRTIVLVTHDLATVERWCDVAAWIDGGKIRRVGSPAEVAQEYREAIKLAEAQSMSFVPAGLSETGGALPQVPGHENAPVSGSLGHPLQLSGLQLSSAGSASVEQLDSEAALEVSVDYSVSESGRSQGIAVAVMRDDNTVVFGTDSFTEPLPAPLAGAGRLRLSLPRLGLIAGRYRIEVAAVGASGGSALGPVLVAPITVTSAVHDRDIVRPAHSWQLEPVGAAGEPSGRPEWRTGS